jgi:DNA repair exonuclease SbcCD ATPase subunit
MSEEREEQPTSNEQEKTEISIEEKPNTVLQEDKAQEQKKKIEEEQREKPSVMKKKQTEQAATSLSDTSKQVEKNANQINKITMLIQSLQKQTNLTAVGQSESIKQIRSQLSLLQKQVSQIQKDIQRIVTAASGATITRTRKSVSTMRPKFKIRKSAASTRVRRSRKK